MKRIPEDKIGPKLTKFTKNTTKTFLKKIHYGCKAMRAPHYDPDPGYNMSGGAQHAISGFTCPSHYGISRL